MEPQSYAGRWRRCTAATNAVLEWLHRATKPKSKNAKKKVKKKGARSADTAAWTMAQIYAAALEVVDAGTTVPSSVLRDLMVVIRLRFDAYIKLPADQRDGHGAYVDVLRAVLTKWLPITDDLQTLVGPLQDMRTGRRDRDDVGQRDYFPHLPPFDVDAFPLPVDDDMDPSLDAQRREMQFACMCFVLDMADLMHDAKLGWIMHKESAMCASVPAAITNAGVYAVEVLHTELREAYPHLSDVEAIMATLRCGRFIVEIVCSHHVSVDKAAGMLMVARRAAIERLKPLSIQVMTKALSTSALTAGRLIDRIVAQLEGDDYWNMNWTTTLGKGDSITALHAYLKTFIVHALREPGTRAITYPDTFGPAWVEGDSLLRCTTDLYQSFFADVLPPLLLDAQAGVAPNGLVYENELAPLRRLFMVYVQTQQVPVSLLFACQAMLWSLFYTTQGRSSVGINVARLATSTRRAVDDVASQLDRCRAAADGTTRERIDAARNWLAYRQRLAAPSKVFSAMEQDHAWYNPYMAGQMMLLLRLEMSYVLGLSTMDDIGQTHILLHLYHALYRRGKIAASTEMEMLATAFPQVFVDGRPAADFASAHLRSYGYDAATAASMAAHLLCDDMDTVTASLDGVQLSSKKSKKPRSLPSLATMPKTMAWQRVTRLELPRGNFADDYTDWMRTLRDEIEGIHALNLPVLGQLFRDAWMEMATALGFHGTAPLDRSRDVPHAVRFANENRCVQTLLALCDRSPDDPRLLVAATTVQKLVQRMPEARIANGRAA